MSDRERPASAATLRGLRAVVARACGVRRSRVRVVIRKASPWLPSPDCDPSEGLPRIELVVRFTGPKSVRWSTFWGADWSRVAVQYALRHFRAIVP